MNIEEFKNKLSTFTDEERKKHVEALFEILTPMSFNHMMEFQREWDVVNRPYTEFVKEQNDTIIILIELEVSKGGILARQMRGLEPLTLETEIVGKVEAEVTT